MKKIKLNYGKFKFEYQSDGNNSTNISKSEKLMILFLRVWSVIDLTTKFF